MNWFENIFGFIETKDNVKKYISYSDNIAKNKKDNSQYKKGSLKVLSLKELKDEIKNFERRGTLQYREIFGNIKTIHQTENNVNIQVASQFNLLEMVSPRETKEMGITKYINDKTQGPICAMACPVGTLYRNYETDINTLDNIQDIFNKKYITMLNGYALFYNIDDNFHKILKDNKELIEDSLKIGVMEQTQVIFHDIPSNNLVNQIYCSAIPLSYQQGASYKDLEEFSKIVLKSLYESTYIYSIMSNNPILYLTQVGCGAFGNNINWVTNIIKELNEKYKNYNLSVFMVNYKG